MNYCYIQHSFDWLGMAGLSIIVQPSSFQYHPRPSNSGLTCPFIQNHPTIRDRILQQIPEDDVQDPNPVESSKVFRFHLGTAEMSSKEGWICVWTERKGHNIC